MVKLEEVLDESFREGQAGPEDEWGTDDDSDAASVTSDVSNASSADEDETLADRLAALKDIIPPSTRRSLSAWTESATGYASAGLRAGGKTLWVVTTSVLLLGVPWAMAFAEEQQMEAYAAELEAQRGAGEMLTQGTPQEGKPAL